MKLNHESYEKAFSNITLDDRIGMELLSNAKVKRLHLIIIPYRYDHLM